MAQTMIDRDRIQAAWQGRISGCQLGKPVELLSMREGHAALTGYLERAEALPLRDYVPLIEGTPVAQFGRASCRGVLERSEPDDDINYSVLALMLLERHGRELTTTDVARAWLLWLPAGMTFTAERAAYRTLLERAGMAFAQGAEAGFDLAACADNEFSDWIGAQIRADVYGWVCPGQPALAAELAEVHMGSIRSTVAVPEHHLALLGELGGQLRIGLCSNFTDTETALAILDEAGFREHFDAIAISEAVGWRKPREEIFRAVLDELGVAPGEALHVGDSLRADVAGGAAVGMRTAWLTRRVADPEKQRREHDGPPPDHEVADLAEIPPLLARGEAS